ncbi:MAG: hypothetical protein ACXU82_13550 [Caulobacteraceae bacterium]
MLRPIHPVLACAAWLTATAAMAQTAPPRANVALTTGDVEKQAFEFVQAHAASTVKIDQIPRWRAPVCAQVIGLPDDQAAQVKARVEEVAKAVGTGAGPANCKANVQIAFAAQPQRIVDNFAKGREWVLGFHHLDPKVRVVTQPIQAWYATATLGGVGNNTGWAFAYTGVPSQSGGNATQIDPRVLDSPDSWSPTGCGDSTFTSCLQSVFANVFIVVDTSRVQGKSVGVLSDYVAMMALSQPRSIENCHALPSVTDLFSASCAAGAAEGLTAADAAYLTALYQANPEARKLNEQADIAGRMAKMLAPAAGVAR